MASLQRLADATAVLLGRSTYQVASASVSPWLDGLDLDSPTVERLRRMLGGQLQLASITQSKWYLEDLATAEQQADAGTMALAARLMSWCRRDGIVAGVLSTRTDGLVRLPKRFRGDKSLIDALGMGHNSVRSVFDEMFPPSELAALAADGILLGVGVGELLPVQGRAYPVFCRLDPQYLQYVWTENRWYYQSAVGRLPITPGDGRWILHTPGGRIAPWQGTALWRAIGQACIRKAYANNYKDAWEAKLAHPARVALAPAGSTEQQKDGLFRALMAWGINTVFSLPIGYDVKLLESNGRGADSFRQTIDDQNNECIIALSGQSVTVDGGAGFQNSDIHKSIRADLIKGTADGLAYTINTQGLPVYVALVYGEDAVDNKPCLVEWDVTPPKDRNAEALSMVTASQAITGLTVALEPAGLDVETPQLCEQFSIPYKRRPLRLVGDGADAKDPEDTALNGAQIGSLLEIVRACAAHEIPRDAALGMIKRSFRVDDANAEELLGSAGTDAFAVQTDAPAPPALAPVNAIDDEVAA